MTNDNGDQSPRVTGEERDHLARQIHALEATVAEGQRRGTRDILLEAEGRVIERRRAQDVSLWKHPVTIVVMTALLACFGATVTSVYAAILAYNSKDTIVAQNDDLQRQIDCGRGYTSATNEAIAEVLQSLGLQGAAVLDGLAASRAGDIARLEEILAGAGAIKEDTRADVAVLFQAVESQRQSIILCSPSANAITNTTIPPVGGTQP